MIWPMEIRFTLGVRQRAEPIDLSAAGREIGPENAKTESFRFYPRLRKLPL